MNGSIHAGDIAGVIIHIPTTHEDKVDPGETVGQPGFLRELWRDDLPGFPNYIAQTTQTLAYQGTVKAFHRHQLQYDIWYFVTGEAWIVLRDLRADSPTCLATMEIYAGWENPKLVLIPPGVAHGYKVLSNEPAMLIYHTTRVYDPTDEGRYDPNDERMQYDWDKVPLEATI